MNYRQVIGGMPGGDIEPASYLYNDSDAWLGKDALTYTDGNSPPVTITDQGENIYSQYTIVIEPDEDGFHAFCPALKGCHTCGNTQAEALGYIQDAIVGYVASLEKRGDPIPSDV